MHQHFCQLAVSNEIWLYARSANTLQNPKKCLFNNQTNGLCGLPTTVKRVPTDSVQIAHGLRKNMRLAFDVDSGKAHWNHLNVRHF